MALGGYGALAAAAPGPVPGADGRPQVTGADLIAAGLTPDSRFRELLAYAHKLHLAAVTHDSALKQTLAYARKLRVTEN